MYIYMVHTPSQYVNVEESPRAPASRTGTPPFRPLSGAHGSRISTLTGQGKTAETYTRWSLEIHACEVCGSDKTSTTRGSQPRRVPTDRWPGIASRVPRVPKLHVRVALATVDIVTAGQVVGRRAARSEWRVGGTMKSSRLLLCDDDNGDASTPTTSSS